MTIPAGATAAATPTALDDDPAVRVVFTDRRHGTLSRRVGAGDAGEARRRLLGALGLAPRDAVFMEQVHGNAVATVDPATDGAGGDERTVAGVDGLVTRGADTALVVLVADCVPLLLAVPGRAVGAVHAGRRGVAAGIVPRAVSTLVRAADAGAGDVTAVVGPAIGGCCYEVPDDVAAAVVAVAPSARTTTRRGTGSVDLPTAVDAQLRAAGVTRVVRAGRCTACDPTRSFSHRAAVAGVASPGRQAAAIVRVAGQRDSASLH